LSEGFSALNLTRETQAALQKAKLSQPTPLQAKVIPPALLGRDIVAVSAPGAGRTTSFLIGLVERLSHLPGTRALVLSRTKQRVAAVHEQLKVLSHGRTFKVTEILPTGSLAAQEQELRERRPVLLAIPSRLTEHMDKGAVNFSSIEMVVLDAADEMVAEDLLPQLKRIVTRLPPRRQTMIFTRTLIEPLAAFARTYLRDPIMVEVASSEAPPATVVESAPEPAVPGEASAPGESAHSNGTPVANAAKGRVASAMARRPPAPKAKAKPADPPKKTTSKPAKKAR
jgi:ATP-dependent RNA helicase RhlE